MRRLMVTSITDSFRVLALLLGAALAAVLLLAVGLKPAEAAFPGVNGKIAFSSSTGSSGQELRRSFSRRRLPI
jgi:hypothetical protein